MKHLAIVSILACAVNAAPSAENTVGQTILEKALTAEGTPYAWGGGSCDGPSDDQPPYDYGDVGYDCSGLVCWAVCQVTGRYLFTEGLRVTSSMYCASEETLGYKYVCSKRTFDQPCSLVFTGNTPTKSASPVMLSFLAERVTVRVIAAVSIMLGL
ncbi:hypothetical protein BDV11DRAFT_174042 [Aspergillus similis]